MRVQVRDELEQLLDDDGDMADLFLTRKLASSSSPVGGSLPPNWAVGSPTIGSRISRASRASAGTYSADNDVEQLEMLLEVGIWHTIELLFLEKMSLKELDALKAY